jgi:hypothetical protein
LARVGSGEGGKPSCLGEGKLQVAIGLDIAHSARLMVHLPSLDQQLLPPLLGGGNHLQTQKKILMKEVF